MTDLIAELAEVVRLSADDDHDSMIGAGYAVRFIRTHHATLTRILTDDAAIRAAHTELVIRLGEVTTELGAAKRDAERWNHCVSVGRFPSRCQDGERWMAWRSASPTSNVSGGSPSAAIDAAMRDSAREGGE